uniref:Phosphopantetheine adenylyltransferase n=1 Tax=candidate division WOR-3 bacterium TaxID=2052148 RepID=A0A7C4U7W3_UNCW3
MKIAVYPGTFDPVTNGHIDIIKRGRKIFDKIIVLVAIHPNKKTLFTIDERINMLKESLKDLNNVEIDHWDGLLIDYIKKKKVNVIIRGMRAISDFEYEFQMALMNRNLYPDIEIIFLFPDEKYTYLSSSIVKELAMFGKDVKHLVPKIVNEKLIEKYRGKNEKS